MDVLDQDVKKPRPGDVTISQLRVTERFVASPSVVFKFEERCLTRVFPWSDMIHRLNDRLMLQGIVSEEEALQVLSNEAATGVTGAWLEVAAIC